MLNATRAVLNRTRDFFLHGVLPDAGLDELDEFLLKKIGEMTENQKEYSRLCMETAGPLYRTDLIFYRKELI